MSLFSLIVFLSVFDTQFDHIVPVDTTIGQFSCLVVVDDFSGKSTRECTVQADTSGGNGQGASLTLRRTAKGTWSREIVPSGSFEHFSADRHAAAVRGWRGQGVGPQRCLFRVDQQRAIDDICSYDIRTKSFGNEYLLGGFRMGRWRGESLAVRLRAAWATEDLRFPIDGWEDAIRFLENPL